MKRRGRFDPDPPECLSQIMGAQRQEAYEQAAAKLRAEGRNDEADEARFWAAYYGGFRRLVR